MAHPWLVWLSLCYVALVFTGFIHGLTVILGAPGKLCCFGHSDSAADYCGRHDAV